MAQAESKSVDKRIKTSKIRVIACLESD